MTEQVVYNVLDSDRQGFGLLAAYVFFAGLAGYGVLRLRRLKKRGDPLDTRGALRPWARQAFATHARWIVVVLCLAGIVIALTVWRHYRTDSQLLTSGDYQSISGTLDDYRVVEVRSRRPGVLPRNEPGIHEQDRLVVGQQVFFIRCDKNPDEVAGSAGDEERCLDLLPGQQVRVDFVLLSDNQRTAKPLRITRIER